MQRRSIRFTGKVQGVGFRMTAKSVASELGLAGWVRNEHDGSVLMEAQGDPAIIDECLDRIQRQTFGRVDNLQETLLQVEQNETGFDIRR
ncbi:MAG: acylphosphatase [Phycisphaerales bacterium JB061]